MPTRRHALSALAVLPLAATPVAAALGDNPEIIGLLAEIEAQVPLWEVGLDAFEDHARGDSPRDVELSRRIEVTDDLLRQLLAIPSHTAGDLARKILAFRVVEGEDHWEDNLDQGVVVEMSLTALLTDAEAIAGEGVRSRRPSAG